MNKKISLLLVSLVLASILVVGNSTTPEYKIATDDLPPYIGMSMPRV